MPRNAEGQPEKIEHNLNGSVQEEKSKYPLMVKGSLLLLLFFFFQKGN